MEDQRIKTLQYDDNVGVSMDKGDYDLIKAFILRLLDEESAVDPSQLFTRGFDEFKDTFKDQTGLYIYHVKIDLEARGLISLTKTTQPKKRAVITKTTAAKPGHTGGRDANLVTNVAREKIINSQVYQRFVDLFHKVPIVVHAPGRINLCGDYTDCNQGIVLPVTIDRGIQFAVQKARDKTIIYSVHYKQYLAIDFENLDPVSGDEWYNYFLGVINRLKQKGHKLKPFTCVFDGNIPVGAGLSASTALTCGFVMALDTLFQLKLSRLEVIQIAQWTEQHFVGVKCGIGDQFACVMGKENHFIELNSQTLKFDYHPLNLKKYTLLVCNANVDQVLTRAQYNARWTECERGLEAIRGRYPHVRSLREAAPYMVEACEGEMTATEFKRCNYVVEENERVVDAMHSLRRNDLQALGQLMYATHEGLSKRFEASCPELDFLVYLSKNYDGVLGCKMVGGGFGGCTVSIIDDALVGAFIDVAKRQYKQQFNKQLTCFVVKTGNGASVSDMTG